MCGRTDCRCRGQRATSSQCECVVSDGLFGNCQKSVGRLAADGYRYHLSGAERRQLETILVSLVDAGFAWSHRYTQCVIGTVLLAFRTGNQRLDPGYCAASRHLPATWTPRACS